MISNGQFFIFYFLFYKGLNCQLYLNYSSKITSFIVCIVLPSQHIYFYSNLYSEMYSVLTVCGLWTKGHSRLSQ